jgi:hypothetical protein
MRVLAIFNKWWECDPGIAALINQNGRPAGLPWPVSLAGIKQRPDRAALPPENPAPLARAIFYMKRFYVELWCISDLLEHLEDKPNFQSSTQRKAGYMGKIFRGESPGLVVALGTAGCPDARSENGNVVVGTKCFIHDPNGEASNPDSQWNVGPFDRIIDSSLSADSFKKICGIPKASARFLLPPLNPADAPRVLAEYPNVGLSGVNVTDYAKYAQADSDTLSAFNKLNSGLPAKSLETTHGLIRSQSSAPFLFISGITDRVGYFDTEVQPRPYAQNTVAAYNAGIVLGEILAAMDSAEVADFKTPM